MTINEQIWKIAQERARREYEEEFGCWEEADKYERQDLVFSAYMQIKEETK